MRGSIRMKFAWIKFENGIEIREDGYTIYHDPRWVILRNPDGSLEKIQSAEEAKRIVNRRETILTN